MSCVKDTNMSIAMRKKYSAHISQLSCAFFCWSFDHNYESHIMDMCGAATTVGFGYV